MYDYLIVGAGISGLYFANELKKRNIENFIILEQKGRIGGRIGGRGRELLLQSCRDGLIGAQTMVQAAAAPQTMV